MACYRPGQRSRLFYAVREYNGRKDQPKGFGWRDFPVPGLRIDQLALGVLNRRRTHRFRLPEVPPHNSATAGFLALGFRLGIPLPRPFLSRSQPRWRSCGAG